MGQNIRFGIYALIGIFLIYTCFSSGNDNETISEEVVVPTQGLITTLQEVEPNNFKIADEQTIADTASSLVIANYLDSTSDTFTLDQVRAMSQEGEDNYRGNGLARAASFGLMGYFMGRSMGGGRPSSGAYVDQNTYNRVSNGAGNNMQQTAARKTVARPAGKSGYGGTRSTRSVGG